MSKKPDEENDEKEEELDEKELERVSGGVDVGDSLTVNKNNKPS
jgi:bacteriocin-like protein